MNRTLIMCYLFLTFLYKTLNCGGNTSDHSHDERMRDGRLDVQGLFVQGLLLLVVLLGRVHLNLKGVNLQELSSFLKIILPIIRL